MPIAKQSGFNYLVAGICKQTKPDIPRNNVAMLDLSLSPLSLSSTAVRGPYIGKLLWLARSEENRHAVHQKKFR